MSLRVDTVSLISGALVCGHRGLGVRGSQVPASGDAGPGYLYNDWDSGDDAKEFEPPRRCEQGSARPDRDPTCCRNAGDQ